MLFQSTLPYGSDQALLLLAHYVQSFQSTLPCGSDTYVLREGSSYWQFQSTLPYGSDTITRWKFLLLKLFQSTLPDGSDGARKVLNFNASNFNPRSLTGATFLLVSCFGLLSIISIHAPLRERRITGAQRAPYVVDFNPRSLTGATR